MKSEFYFTPQDMLVKKLTIKGVWAHFVIKDLKGGTVSSLHKEYRHAEVELEELIKSSPTTQFKIVELLPPEQYEDRFGVRKLHGCSEHTHGSKTPSDGEYHKGDYVDKGGYSLQVLIESIVEK